MKSSAVTLQQEINTDGDELREIADVSEFRCLSQNCYLTLFLEFCRVQVNHLTTISKVKTPEMEEAIFWKHWTLTIRGIGRGEGLTGCAVAR